MDLLVWLTARTCDSGVCVQADHREMYGKMIRLKWHCGLHGQKHF